MKRNTHISQVAQSVPRLRRDLGISRLRRDLGISRRELAECAEVSEATIVRIESGIRVRPANVIRVANALTALELHVPAKATLTLEDELRVLARNPGLVKS